MRPYAVIAAGALAALPSQSQAQVSGEIVVQTHPVGGVIRFGDRPRYVEVVRPRPRGSVVVVERYAPRVIVVERWRKHKHPKHYDRSDRYRRGVVWYDRSYDRYYDAYRPGLVEIRVFIVDGRYYRYDDDRYYDDRYDRYDDRYGDDRYGRDYRRRDRDRDDWDRDYRDRDRRRGDDDRDDRWDDRRRDDR